MTYCAPEVPNYGFLDHGCFLYGGILRNPRDKSSASDGPSSSLTTNERYIPQFNLAYHWSSPWMKPHSLVYPALLQRTSQWRNEGAYLRAPGHWRYEIPEYRTLNRNLLAGEIAEGSNQTMMRLWAVNEFSDRRRILELSVERVRCEDGLDECVVKNRPFSGEASSKRSSSDLYDPPEYLDLPSPALQLLAWPSGKGQLITRCRRGLFLCDVSRKLTEMIFSSFVCNFHPVAFMDNEIVIVDAGGMVWWGDVDCGKSLSRVKTGSTVKLTAPSDHPRILYCADSESIHFCDIRERSSGRLFYTVPDYDKRECEDVGQIYDGAFKKPVICHIRSLEGMPRMLAVITSRKVLLMDERMPGVSWLQFGHSVHDGGDYFLSAPSFVDPPNHGRIFPFYILTHTKWADVEMFSLYSHSRGLAWSSLGPTKRIVEPIQNASFYRMHAKDPEEMSKELDSILFGRGPTRAIHVQDGLLPGHQGLDSHALFRMMDDGSIWYENIQTGNDECLEDIGLQRNIRNTKKLIEKWKGSRCERSVPIMKPPDSQKFLWDVEADVSDYLHQLVDSSVEDRNPLETSFSEDHPHASPIASGGGPDKILSNIVLNCWKKYV
ncbi:hypothetical protein AB6A40_007916 [Gnathostoma spinigerum]|uniref:DUF1618 domain-containing protein n=1 Tax=Gnathostoma spinigerum TaxID=75299 RepID=A0ABD6EPV5_9BILA